MRRRRVTFKTKDGRNTFTKERVEKPKTFLFRWANGKEVVRGRTLEEACGRIKADPSWIMTRSVVRVTNISDRKTPPQYWGAREFWKHLEGKKKVRE